jgi:hypothetical protein
MTHAQKPDFVFRRNGRVYLNRLGFQFSRLLAAEVYASAVVMLDAPCSEVAWDYLLPTPFVSFPFTFPPLRRRVPSHFNLTLVLTKRCYWDPIKKSGMNVSCEAYGERRQVCRILTWNIKEKDHLECLNVDGRKILKRIFRKSIGWKYVNWVGVGQGNDKWPYLANTIKSFPFP